MATKTLETFGQRLRRLREDAGLGREALGRLCVPPLTGSAIQKLENDLNEPRLGTVRALAAGLGVSERQLAYGKGAA
jgi:transcriptional regulator with XRE-family HTH domain